ncbi:MAG: RluA family pseudouridine synthase [Bacteroidaceae bacterium]|nr:RluA family pseudouridine synthase [Bacteroidaceae bacterium]
MQKSRLHTLSSGADLNPPLLFTNPFSYVPHPLCLEAARELRMLIEENKEWEEELRKGKMFGVMVVRENGRNENNENNGNNGENGYDEAKGLFYLAAFSGQLNGKSEVEGFVPPIFDVSQSTYFQQEMHEIELLVGDKEERRRRSEALQDWLFQQYKCRNARGEEKDLIEIFTDFYRGKMLKQENFARNAASHHIPSGSGECCAPKLLQYAYLHGLAPLCMAEFWVQKSFEDEKIGRQEDETNVDFEDEKTRRREDETNVNFEGKRRGGQEDEETHHRNKEQGFREIISSEIRHDGRFYPACHKKCRPILSFMLDGLDVEESLLEQKGTELLSQVKIIFEDAHILVVDKPSGLLSVPGRGDLKSVADWIRSCHPLPDFWFVHRLDQDTSGLLVIAKDEATYKDLQQQFIRHEVQKTYEALLDGEVVGDEGKIKLRMRPDPDDPPRQIVDMNHGKQAVTRWKVVERLGGQTRVELYPDTGRTHQLRVHCAHPAGLNAPIHGDRLYGVSENPDSNLCLCAKRIRLKVGGEEMEFEVGNVDNINKTEP